MLCLNNMPKRIIVVDDDPCLLESIADFLTSEGYVVSTFTTGEGLLDRVACWRPDLVVLDVRLPGVSGDQLAMQLKSDGSTKLVPVILISASEDLRSVFETVGVEGHLSKPFDLDTFIALIERQISQIRH